mmetsp:Transcript_12915/g.37236  ORF Transcript_12915/g.37236 Transcript_12915/m.37236 type:complete len:423 (-) Transcript_12915:7-1275(-)
MTSARWCADICAEVQTCTKAEVQHKCRSVEVRTRAERGPKRENEEREALSTARSPSAQRPSTPAIAFAAAANSENGSTAFGTALSMRDLSSQWKPSSSSAACVIFSSTGGVAGDGSSTAGASVTTAASTSATAGAGANGRTRSGMWTAIATGRATLVEGRRGSGNLGTVADSCGCNACCCGCGVEGRSGMTSRSGAGASGSGASPKTRLKAREACALHCGTCSARWRMSSSASSSAGIAAASPTPPLEKKWFAAWRARSCLLQSTSPSSHASCAARASAKAAGCKEAHRCQRSSSSPPQGSTRVARWASQKRETVAAAIWRSHVGTSASATSALCVACDHLASVAVSPDVTMDNAVQSSVRISRGARVRRRCGCATWSSAASAGAQRCATAAAMAGAIYTRIDMRTRCALPGAVESCASKSA